MDQFKNRVVDLESFLGRVDGEMTLLTDTGVSIDARVKLAERWLTGMIPSNNEPRCTRVVDAVDAIFRQKGLVDMESLSSQLRVSSRHLEREFKKITGLTFKLFCRIVRFNYIFEIMKVGDASWIDVALQSGYFDQPHFIKNFKEFTGENPSQYGFEEENLANFFLRK